MADIIVAFPKLNDAKNLRKLLIRNGYDVNMVCDSGAQVIERCQPSGWRYCDQWISFFRYVLYRI